MDYKSNSNAIGSDIPMTGSKDKPPANPSNFNGIQYAIEYHSPNEEVYPSYIRFYKRGLGKRFRRLNQFCSHKLFEQEEGKELYEKLLRAPQNGLFELWNKQSTEDQITLLKFIIEKHQLYTSPEGKKELETIIYNVIEYKHFPAAIAKLFFEIIYDNGYFKELNKKLISDGWTSLSMDEKIALLCDLARLYPDLVKDFNKLYDIAIEDPEFYEPIVIKEINRLAIVAGKVDLIYQNFKKHGWGTLSMDEKVVLSNYLCKKHRGITENLDQVLYNLRVYKDIPNAVLAEKYNLSLDGYLKEGEMSSFVRSIIDLCIDQTGRIISIKKVWGVEEARIRAVLQKYQVSLC